MADHDWAALEAAWLPARKAGVLGSATIDELREHAAGFIPAACGVLDEVVGVDLGTGAGVPGILLALALPRSTWILVDASERRCEYARRAVRSMALGDRVEILHARAEEVAHTPRYRAKFDLVVSRLFGPAAAFAECALPLASDRGIVSVSVTGETLQQWRVGLGQLPAELVEHRTLEVGEFLHIRRTGEVPTLWPRRRKAQSREPLLPGRGVAGPLESE